MAAPQSGRDYQVSAAQDKLAASPAKPFDPVPAWTVYERVMRQQYAYKDRAEIDIDTQLHLSQEWAMRAPDAKALRTAMRQTNFALLDRHLVINPYSEGDYGYQTHDLELAFKSGEAVVLDVRRGSSAFVAGVRPGDKVHRIDGSPAKEMAHAPFGEVAWNLSKAQLNYGLTLAANGRAGQDRLLEVSRGDGPKRELRLASVGDYAASLKGRPLIDLELVGEKNDIAHITILDSMYDNSLIFEFDQVMREARKVRAVILDLRETPSGGNSEVARSIIGHFINEERPYQMHRIPSFEWKFTVPRRFVEYAAPRLPYFSGPVVVLHGRWTGSMGEGLVIGMDAATDAVTIGSDMMDLLGSVWTKEISEADATLYYAGERIFHVNGMPREDYIADINIDPANVDADGNDPALSKALSFLALDEKSTF